MEQAQFAVLECSDKELARYIIRLALSDGRERHFQQLRQRKRCFPRHSRIQALLQREFQEPAWRDRDYQNTLRLTI